jgi:prolyl-tRNA synthetase
MTPQGCNRLFDKVSSTYAAPTKPTDEARWAEVPADRQRQGRGIEVGHIFYFGTKYSASLGLKVSGADGSMVTPKWAATASACRGLVGAIIEASHDDNGIIWPEAGGAMEGRLVTMRGDDAASVAAADDIYAKLTAAGVEVLYDDRDERGGVKLGSMDLIGLPWQLIVGPRGLAAGVVELKNRRTGEREELSIDSALERLTA